jgi:magnesium transporter
MIKYFLKKKNEKQFTEVKEYSSGCWIKTINPANNEIDFLVKKFNLSKSNLIDGLDIHENPRFEIENKKAYIFLNAPTENISSEYDSSFLIIYSKDLFITISKSPLEVIEKLLDTKSTLDKFSFSRLLLKLLFLLSRTFELSVRGILRSTKKNKKDLSKLTDKDIVRLIKEEDKLNQYISSFGAIIQTYNRVLRDKTIKLFKKDEEILEDLIIDLNETLTLCGDTLKSISNMRSYYSTKLSNDLNKKVTLLTIFTIFLTTPTLIAGIYGMNVILPLQTSPNILILLGGIVLGIWILMFTILKMSKII